MHVQGNLVLRSLALCFTLLFMFSVVEAQGVDDDTGPLVVEETSGAAKIKLDNRWQSPAAGMVVALPATVSTGSDGSVQLRQDQTVISIAANTAIELIAGPESGTLLQRVVQDKGSAFYDIEPRVRSRLRVETPWLVAVIKGTEFNVTVAAETSTVALFEGRLQIEAPDVGDVINLRQGQIAKRHKDDRGITVLPMDGTEAVPEREAPPEARGSEDAAGGLLARRDDDGNSLDRTGNVSGPELFAGGDQTAVELDAVEDLGLPDVGLELANGIDSAGINAMQPDTALGLAGGAIDLAMDVGADLGNAVVDVGLDAGVDLAGGDIDLGLTGDIGIGAATADLGLDVGLDLAGSDIDLGLDAGIDAGVAAVDLGTDVAVDLDQGSLDLGLDGGLGMGGDTLADAAIDAGIDASDSGIGVDTGLDAGLGLDDTSLDASLDTGIDIGGGDVAAGLDTGAEVSVAGVDAGVDIGLDLDLGNLDNLDVDLDVGLDLPDEDDDEDAGEGEAVNLPLDPGDLLDLLRF